MSLRAEGDRVLSLEEIVALADAVAPMGGIASGMGTTTYGAQLVVDAGSAEEAMKLAVPAFEEAAALANLPTWPLMDVNVLSEDEELSSDE
ncbi:MAG TPA: hypothetical protein EYM59_07620 [Acidimicrobiia bacterium]|nr:hypothetical protein [bacterium AH-315-A03]MCH2348877.1 hypothetical protein [Candidatus Poseidoniales archaeon]HIC54951.1 hypothetical protein [Gemmatimonadota bacterium]HIM85609.1 hypothetical protein [Acidimicrobiia bacterium]